MQPNRTFKQIAFTHFVPCFFLGVIFLFFVRAFAPEVSLEALTDKSLTGVDLVAGILNGFFVAALVVSYHAFRNYKINKGPTLFYTRADRNTFVYGSFIGFLCGTFDIVFGFHNIGILILTTIVLVTLVWHVRVFAADVVEILKPGNHATWHEVAELLRIYMTMLAGFTLVNATLEVGHLLTGTTMPFEFGAQEGELFLNSFYFTVVTMTTLGYGDIVPKTWDAKLLLILQSLTSYVMFALMVGIITRGVLKRKNSDTE